MDNLTQMHKLGLLTEPQYLEISAYLRSPLSRQQVVEQLPQPLWTALQQAAALALTRPEATILLGDLNLTPYAPAFARLVAESGLRDAFAGEAWRPTWQAEFWPLALPIDHVLVPRRGCVTGHEIGPYVGSDHRPLQVTLRLPLS